MEINKLSTINKTTPNLSQPVKRKTGFSSNTGESPFDTNIDTSKPVPDLLKEVLDKITKQNIIIMRMLGYYIPPTGQRRELNTQI